MLPAEILPRCRLPNGRDLAQRLGRPDVRLRAGLRGLPPARGRCAHPRCPPRVGKSLRQAGGLRRRRDRRHRRVPPNEQAAIASFSTSTTWTPISTCRTKNPRSSARRTAISTTTRSTGPIDRSPPVYAALAENGLRDKTLVVIAADHGEAFQEHGNEGHARDLHREVVRTPWIISLPFSLQPGNRDGIHDGERRHLADDSRSPGRVRSRGGGWGSRLPEVLAAVGVVDTAAPVTPPRPSYAQLDRTWGQAARAGRSADRRHRRRPSLHAGIRQQAFRRALRHRGGPAREERPPPRRPAARPETLDDLIDAYTRGPSRSWRKDVEERRDRRHAEGSIARDRISRSTSAEMAGTKFDERQDDGFLGRGRDRRSGAGLVSRRWR